MAKTFTFSVASHNVTMFCSYRNTRNGFAHDCEMSIDNCPVSLSHSCYYLNRRWEAYDYQTVMRETVREAINEQEKRVKQAYKAENGIKRMTEKHQNALHEIMAKDESLKMLKKLKAMI